MAHDQNPQITQSSLRSPKVSACLLTYNHRDVVQTTIESALQQTCADFELIISDDCSTDGTYELLCELAQAEPRLRVVQPRRNLGMPGNANFAVRQARGDYIALLHHDDIYSPRLLEAWSRVLDRNPTVGFVSNSYGLHGSSAVSQHPFAERNLGTRVLRHEMLNQWGCPLRGTAMIRRRCWDAVGGMREQFGMLADVDLWMRLAARYDLGYVPEVLITVRHARPAYYPEAYWRWSWRRLKLAYEIYGANHESFYGGETWHGRARLALYRARVNADIVKWLGYGLVKRRKDILTSSQEVANRFEYRPVAALRRLLARVA